MRRNIVKDERALAQKRKIGSDTCNLLLGGLLVSVLVQQYIFNAPFSQYAVEFISFSIAGLYIVFRNIIVGNDVFEAKMGSKKIIIVNSLVTGLLVSVVSGIANYATYSEKYVDHMGMLFITWAILFFSGTAITFLISSLIHVLNQNKQKKIAEELDKDEDCEE